ncbi:hypothetical protein JOF42_000398 [Microbacterium phyllosphaerae]|uniref:LPXTG cell wall anchor domain-containing protein n=1 Tax=Microbacterium phyllosphaerae TaxID=124798 RepID=A0ABS4WL25_9MICO|nr:hypothetical protein [Microbacterium phyllosphaerae]MBP2376903.1 hypothetical protein [Microbacterium phyllosphaerae]
MTVNLPPALVRTLSVTAASVLLTLATVFVPSAAHAEDASDLTVTPGSALFEVVLEPGVPQARMLTLTNSGASPLAVYLTAELDEPASTSPRFTEIGLQTDVVGSCADAVFDAGRLTAMNNVDGLHQTVVPAHSSVNVCVNAAIADSGAERTASTTVVHLQFHAMERSDGLAETGAEPHALLLWALLLTMLGLLLASLRRRDRSRDSDASALIQNGPQS